MKSKGYRSLFVLFAFIVTSCGGAPTPPPGNPYPNVDIDIQITTSESKEIGTETISQPNCTGAGEVENVVEKSRTIEYVMEVQNEVAVNANGQIGFAGTDVELGATIASQFGQSYGSSDTITRSITVKAPPGTNMQHIIRQAEVWQVGKATITVGGQQTIIPFKFRSDFAIELVESKLIACVTEEAAPLISVTNDLTATPGLPVGMDVQLITDTTSGTSPLTVNFDARESFLRDANGVIYKCWGGPCNYTWYVYKDGKLVYQSDRAGGGTFKYKFGQSGEYRVVVRVCRGQADSDCAYDGEEISVQ